MLGLSGRKGCGWMRLYLSSFAMGNQPQELVSLSRGGARAAVIVNAADLKDPMGREASVRLQVDTLGALGFDAEEMDLRRYFGRSRALSRAISRFDLVWVRGGNLFLLRRAFRLSGFDEVLEHLLGEDAVAYGGYSAGACVLSPSLRGMELVDDPAQVPEGYEAGTVWDGLGLLPYMIAPHYKSEHPESPRIDELVRYFIDNHMLFRALRDGEAIVVDGDRESVVS